MSYRLRVYFIRFTMRAAMGKEKIHFIPRFFMLFKQNSCHIIHICIQMYVLRKEKKCVPRFKEYVSLLKKDIKNKIIPSIFYTTYIY